MDSQKINRNYDRVMSRVFNQSRSNLRSGSNVTRHDVSSSVRVGAKASGSAVNSSVFSEFPTVLNDFVSDVDQGNVVKRPLVKPKRTLKSLDPGKVKSPPRASRARGLEYSRNIRTRGSAPIVLSSNGEEWAESHVRQCYSSRSHTRLKELKDEIKAFHETDKMLKLRSHLYQSCGVVLDDVGRVARDQAVQADPGHDKEITSIRRLEWLKRIERPDLLKKTDLRPTSYRVCSIHFENSMMSSVHIRKLLPGAVPTKFLTKPQPTTTAGTPSDSPVEEHISKTSIALSSNMPKKKRFCVQLQEPERKRKTLEDELNAIRQEIEVENLLSLDPSEDHEDEITKRFYKLIQWQNSVRNRYQGNRYDAEYKFFALNLHYSCPQTYRSLKRILKLPSKSTLSKFKLRIRPEIDDQIFNTIASKLESLPDKAKYCTICVDEMVLKRNLYYDIKHDEIFGLQNINGNVTKDIVSNAYVVMLRGIAINWKQPIGYALLASTKHYQEIDEWMNEVVSKLLTMGIKVMAIVSDHGSNFDKYAKEIKRITPEKPYFNYNDNKIYYIFDVPHMLKCIRNNLLTNDFYWAGQKISWDYIRRLYSHQKEQNLRLLPKITDAHINPNNLQKLRVKYAAQIFSRNVYGALNTFIHAKLLPEDARPTAEFIKTMNDLFDVLNSSKIKSSNKYQKALSLNDDQIKILEAAQRMFETITATNQKTGSDNTNGIKTFKNFQITIRAIILICKDLKQEGVRFIFTRRLNQDPLENFFRSVRQQGGNCWKPTSIQFTRAFSKLFVCNMLTNSRSTNCKSDLCDLLLKANDMISRETEAKQTPSKTLKTSSVISLDGEVDYRFDLPTKNALTYIAGYLLFKCAQKHHCSEFYAYLKFVPQLKDTAMFIHYKALNTQSSFYGGLKAPLEPFVNYIKRLETTFLNNFDKIITNHPGTTLFNLLKNITFNPPCPCFPSLYLLKLFVRFRIFSTIKFNNRRFKDGNKNSRYYIKVKQL